MSISWPARKPASKAVETTPSGDVETPIRNDVAVQTKKSRRKTAKTPYEELMRVRSEIESEMSRACPEHAEFITTIRRFASSRLSSSSNKVLGIVSAKAGEGRTTVALAIAAALSEMHQRVIYVECDGGGTMTLLSQLGEHQLEGLSEWLAGESSASASIYETASGQLFVLPFGGARVSSTPLETVSRMRSLFDKLRTSFDVVVVDMPAVLVNEGAPALIKELDNILLVVGANQTTASEVDETVRLCGYIPVSGIFLNKSEYSAPDWVISLVSPTSRRPIS